MQSQDYAAQITHYRYLPPTEAEYNDLELRPELREAMGASGIRQLYSHQGQALALLRQEKDTGIVTPTASGKTLIYNLAVTERLLADPDSRALYLFPLKALAQDQLKTLTAFFQQAGLDHLTAAVYDGDTPASVRSKLRRNPPRVLITNPDMLHFGLLAYPEGWKTFFQNLRFVVIDEAHTYRGVFGSHVALILRRLQRLCPAPGFTLAASSATMANAKEFLDRLTGRDFQVIDRTGSPRQGRHVLLVNPSGSPYTAAAGLLEECLDQGVKTIMFTKSRKITELIHIWVREAAPKYEKRIAAYRSGYLPEERRKIEQRLFSNELAAVISTSALEAGIDVGGLDACILVGYPGTMISTWQRVGRAGRGQREALTIMIALPDALDQYFIRHPDKFFSSAFENCVLDPGNDQIVRGHLPCAACELALGVSDAPRFGEAAWRRVPMLVQEGLLQENAAGDQWFSSRKHPHRLVDIRSVGEQYQIVNGGAQHAVPGKNAILGSIEEARVFKECHPSAIYLHAGTQYEVVGLNLATRVVQVAESEADWYTQYTSSEEIEILDLPAGQVIRASSHRFSAGLVRVRVTEKIVSYERHRVEDQSLLSEHKLDLPPRVFETQAVLLTVPDIYRKHCLDYHLDFAGGLHAIEHALIASLPVHVLCDRWDLGGLSTIAHPQTNQPCMFIYDGYPGGMGLAAKGLEVLADWFQTTREIVTSCECEDGCPACIHSPKCGSRNKPLDKQACRMLLNAAIKDPALALEFIPENRVISAVTLAAPVVAKPDPMKAWTSAAPAPVTRPPAPPQPMAPECMPETALAPVFSQDRQFRLLVFDLETQHSAAEVGGWNQAHKMKMSLGVVYDHQERRYVTYTEDRAPDLIQHLLSADKVVGFNIDRFDLAVLSAYSPHVARIRTFDILTEVQKTLGYRVSLDGLASVTLGQGKSADGLQAIAWWQAGNLKDLETYCRKDVEITKDIFLFGLRYGYLLYERNGAMLKIPVNWSGYFPENLNQEVQGL
jgi:DEAD/DEAH box helicase domain-containing protein